MIDYSEVLARVPRVRLAVSSGNTRYYLVDGVSVTIYRPSVAGVDCKGCGDRIRKPCYHMVAAVGYHRLLDALSRIGETMEHDE